MQDIELARVAASMSGLDRSSDSGRTSPEVRGVPTTVIAYSTTSSARVNACEFADRNSMECGWSLRLDVGRPDHLAPLLGLFGDAPLSALVRRGARQSERGALGMHRGICSIQAHRNNSAGWVRPNGLGERLAMQPDPQIHGLCGRRLRSRRFRQDGRNRRELHRPGHAA